MKALELNQEDVLHFLRTVYFGKYDDIIAVASDRAYRDFCRTIRSPRFKATSAEAKEQKREEITLFLKEEIGRLSKKKEMNRRVFDEWHSAVCRGIINKFSLDGLYYGQAQKWLNMTFKYICALDTDAMNQAKYFEYLHIPMDNIIIEKAVESGLINRPNMAWSRWDEEEYKRYQKALIDGIHQQEGKNYPPLLWEFKHWKAS